MCLHYGYQVSSAPTMRRIIITLASVATWNVPYIYIHGSAILHPRCRIEFYTQPPLHRPGPTTHLLTSLQASTPSTYSSPRARAVLRYSASFCGAREFTRVAARRADSGAAERVARRGQRGASGGAAAHAAHRVGASQSSSSPHPPQIRLLLLPPSF